MANIDFPTTGGTKTVSWSIGTCSMEGTKALSFDVTYTVQPTTPWIALTDLYPSLNRLNINVSGCTAPDCTQDRTATINVYLGRDANTRQLCPSHSITVNQSALNCNCSTLNFSINSFIPSGGTSIGTVIGSYNRDCDETKIDSSPSAVNLRFINGEIQLAENIGPNSTYEPKKYQIVIFYNSSPNPCLVDNLIQEAYPCDCTSIEFIVHQTAKYFTYNYDPTSSASRYQTPLDDVLVASANTDCGWFGASTEPNDMLVGGNTPPNYGVNVTPNSQNSAITECRVSLKPNTGSSAVDRQISIHITFRNRYDGEYQDCGQYITLNQKSNYQAACEEALTITQDNRWGQYLWPYTCVYGSWDSYNQRYTYDFTDDVINTIVKATSAGEGVFLPYVNKFNSNWNSEIFRYTGTTGTDGACKIIPRVSECGYYNASNLNGPYSNSLAYYSSDIYFPGYYSCGTQTTYVWGNESQLTADSTVDVSTWGEFDINFGANYNQYGAVTADEAQGYTKWVFYPNTTRNNRYVKIAYDLYTDGGYHYCTTMLETYVVQPSQYCRDCNQGEKEVTVNLSDYESGEWDMSDYVINNLSAYIDCYVNAYVSNVQLYNYNIDDWSNINEDGDRVVVRKSGDKVTGYTVYYVANPSSYGTRSFVLGYTIKYSDSTNSCTNALLAVNQAKSPTDHCADCTAMEYYLNNIKDSSSSEAKCSSPSTSSGWVFRQLGSGWFYQEDLGCVVELGAISPCGYDAYVVKCDSNGNNEDTTSSELTTCNGTKYKFTDTFVSGKGFKLSYWYGYYDTTGTRLYYNLTSSNTSMTYNIDDYYKIKFYDGNNVVCEYGPYRFKRSYYLRYQESSCHEPTCNDVAISDSLWTYNPDSHSIDTSDGYIVFPSTGGTWTVATYNDVDGDITGTDVCTGFTKRYFVSHTYTNRGVVVTLTTSNGKTVITITLPAHNTQWGQLENVYDFGFNVAIRENGTDIATCTQSQKTFSVKVKP